MTFNKQGLYQSLGIVGYVSLVAGIMWNIEKVLGQTADSYFAPVTFITLFSTSALICGLIVFYKPYTLFLAGKKKEAIDVVVSTAISLFAILVLLFTILFLSK